MTEQLEYQVVRKYPKFEVRHYPEHVLVQIQAEGDFNRASFKAFNPLVSYISGANKSGVKIAMTAPVIQQEIEFNKHLVSFVLPKSVSVSNIPVPENVKLSTKVISPKDAAVISYRGSWNENLMQQKSQELLEAVKQAGLITSGAIQIARFDPPWKPGFLKRNEVMVDLVSSSTSN